MSVIWKYPIEITDEQEIEMPSDSKILSVSQSGLICLYVYVFNPASPKIKRKIVIFGTGNKIEKDPGGKYIGTITTHGQSLVWHIFEDKRDS